MGIAPGTPPPPPLPSQMVGNFFLMYLFFSFQTDALDRLPSLVSGLNVNIYFDRVDRYEFTNSSAIFDVLGVRERESGQDFDSKINFS